MERSETTGQNRTGIDISPIDSKKMVDAADEYPPSHFSGETIQSIKRAWIEEAERLGSVPIPGTAKGALKTLMETFTGHHPATFINKLGERLAFERSGTRIYESLLLKCEIANHEGKLNMTIPLDRLRTFRDQEAEHFQMLVECFETLGADPTAQTPDADVSGVAASGMMKVVTDPRTTVPQCLEAMLALELTDHAAWDLLIKMAEDLGKDDMATRFQKALSEEEIHLREIRELYEQLVRDQASMGTQTQH